MKFLAGHLETDTRFAYVGLVYESNAYDNWFSSSTSISVAIDKAFKRLEYKAIKDNIDCIMNTKIETNFVSNTKVVVTVYGDAIRFLEDDDEGI